MDKPTGQRLVVAKKCACAKAGSMTRQGGGSPPRRPTASPRSPATCPARPRKVTGRGRSHLPFLPLTLGRSDGRTVGRTDRLVTTSASGSERCGSTRSTVLRPRPVGSGRSGHSQPRSRLWPPLSCCVSSCTRPTAHGGGRFHAMDTCPRLWKMVSCIIPRVSGGSLARPRRTRCLGRATQPIRQTQV